MADPLLLCLTSQSDSIICIEDERRAHIRKLQLQELRMRECRFWEHAMQMAKKWSARWAAAPCSPHLTDCGEDLLAQLISAADGESYIQLAATCRSLRGLLLPKLQQKSDQCMQRFYMSMALGQ
jgi:hypothetical protein